MAPRDSKIKNRRSVGDDLGYTIFVWICVSLIWTTGALQIYSLNITMGSGGTSYVLSWCAEERAARTRTAGPRARGGGRGGALSAPLALAQVLSLCGRAQRVYVYMAGIR